MSKSKVWKKLYRIIVILVALFMINVGATALFIDGYKVESYGDEKTEQLYVLPLMDTYDSSGGDSIGDILSRNNLLEDLKNLYDDLCSSEEFEYIPITEPSVYYYGEYTGSEDTIVGGESMRNELNEEGLQTGLNTVQINEELSHNLSAELESGRIFLDEDFKGTYRQVIPVLLGTEFADDFHIGDKLPVYYYMKKTELEVVGFLKSGSALNCGELGWYLDYYIVLPDIGLSDQKADEMCNTIIMMDKCEAYAGVEEKEEVQSAVERIALLADKYDFEYDIESLHKITAKIAERTDTSSDVREDIEYSLSENERIIYEILLFVGIILLLLICAIGIKGVDSDTRKNFTKVKGLSLAVISFNLQMIVSYVISYWISRVIIAKCIGDPANGYVMILHGNVRAGIFILCIVTSVVMCIWNKNGWRDEQW